MASGFKVKGQKRLMERVKKMANAKELFDKDLKNTALVGQKKLARATPVDSGDTRRAWQPPNKLGLSKYVVENKKKSGDYLLIEVLDQGRKEVRPVNASRLYIPLSKKGKGKANGAKIPKDFIWGVDYILAKKSKAVKGKKFIDRVGLRMTKYLMNKIIKRIRTTHGK